jgi:hypothetical protein
MPAALKTKPKVAFASRIGRVATIFDEKDILEREGNQSAFARRYGVQRTTINLVLAGKPRVSEAIKNALGLWRTYSDAK